MNSLKIILSSGPDEREFQQALRAAEISACDDIVSISLT